MGGTCVCSPGYVSPASHCANATEALLALELKYEAARKAACAQVSAKVPTLPAADAAAFMPAYQGFFGNSSEAPVLAAAQKLMTPAVDEFLSLPDSFAAADGQDAAMVKCAVMTEAARGFVLGHTNNTDLLAKFAVAGPSEEALVDKLLGDPALMRDMLVAGGAANGYYGEAMSIYSTLVKKSSALQAAVAAAPTSGPWDERNPANSK